MTVSIHQISTEYLFVGVTGNQPSTTQEIAFMDAATVPTEVDWETAILVDSDLHALWEDALAAANVGDYFLAILIGDFGEDGVSLTPGDYTVWVRLTDSVEQPVRIVSEALEVL